MQQQQNIVEEQHYRRQHKEAISQCLNVSRGLVLFNVVFTYIDLFLTFLCED